MTYCICAEVYTWLVCSRITISDWGAVDHCDEIKSDLLVCLVRLSCWSLFCLLLFSFIVSLLSLTVFIISVISMSTSS